ncbi:MAG: C69 family dipeptidase, partial [Atribacterota bacterium]
MMKFYLRKLIYLIFIMVMLFSLSVLADSEPEVDSLGCTSFLVGKDASLDGSTMTVHPCDCGICDFTFRRVAAEDHESGDTRKIYAISQYETWD